MNKNDRILHIDTWRLIAVVLVILHHLTHFSNLSSVAKKFPGIIWRLDSLGRLGVFLFFCISGFVICRGLMKEKDASESVSLNAFYVRRGLRIMPPLLVYLGFVLMLSAVEIIEFPVISAVRSATFVCNFFWLWECGWFAGHTWSLAYEEQFYLLFPILFVAMAFSRKPRTLLLIISALTGIILWAQASQHFSLADYCTMFVYMLYGCASALYWEKLRPVFNRIPVYLWCFLVISILLLGGLIALPPIARPLAQVLLLPPLICVVILGTPTYNPIVRSLFESRFLSYLGKTSYTVYLWQQLATANYPALAPYWNIIFVAGVFLLAHFSYQYFERPLMRIGARYSASRKNIVSSNSTVPA